MKRHYTVFLSIVIVLVSALSVAGVLYAYNTAQPKKSTDSSAVQEYDPAKESETLSNDINLQEQQTGADVSKDFGACRLTNARAIADALGRDAATVQAGVDRGVGYVTGGVQAQSCSYSLATGETGSHRLTVTVTQYSDIAAAKAAYEPFPTIAIKDNAYFIATIAQPDPNNPIAQGNNYALTVFDGSKKIDFTLQVPQAVDELTEQTARTALETIGRQATY